MALITTPGAANANSYASVAEGDTYHATHLYASGWNSATEAQKEAGLIMATRGLDAMPAAWTGAAAGSVQALGWPRTGMSNRNGFAIANTVVPNELKNATCEYARLLIENNLLAYDETRARGVKSVKEGPVTLSFKEDRTEREAQKAMVPDSVITLLVPSWLVDDRDADADYVGFVMENL